MSILTEIILIIGSLIGHQDIDLNENVRIHIDVGMEKSEVKAEYHFKF